MLYEDDEVLVLNKPAGLAVQGGTKTSHHIDRLLSAWGEGLDRPRLTHRLDRDTSGVLVLGKSPNAAARLAGAFAKRRAQKTYWAIVEGNPAPRRRGDRLAAGEDGCRRPRNGDARRSQGSARPASRDRLRHRLTRRTPGGMAGATAAYWPDASVARTPAGDRPPDPGRSQVQYTRSSIATAGPLKLQLHARRLALPHPARGLIDIVAPLSPEMAAGFARFGFDTHEADDDPFTRPRRR